MSGGKRVLAMVFCVGLSSCQGALPGPQECEAMALSYYGLTQKDLIVSRIRRAAVAELTRECLTAPYDGEAVRCMQERHDRSICRLALKRRRQGARPSH